VQEIIAMPREGLGDIEQFVLVALVRLGGESYGVPILEEIAGRTGRAVSRPAVYIALRRLQAKGLLTSRLGEATAERGGRAKRYFRITRAGARHLQQWRHAAERMWADVEPLVRKAAR
jgi:DNA-binding PadR family transcriptional regulator